MSNAEQSRTLRGRTVGGIAAAIPGATSVFRSFNIDFCCHGDVGLDTLVREASIEPSEVEAQLNALEAPTASNPSSWSTGDLINHVLTRYHEVHRRELTDLIELAKRVEGAHADHSQLPLGLSVFLRQLLGELEVHMKKEELILFPAMRRQPQSGLAGPIAQMRHDHDDHGGLLHHLEEVTNGFQVPDGACRSWQALYRDLSKLDGDLREHIHLENNVLFPRHEGREGRAHKRQASWSGLALGARYESPQDADAAVEHSIAA